MKIMRLRCPLHWTVPIGKLWHGGAILEREGGNIRPGDTVVPALPHKQLRWVVLMRSVLDDLTQVIQRSVTFSGIGCCGLGTPAN